MLQMFLVFIGGGIGALGRWWLGVFATRVLGGGWPWGTLSVNVLGGFAMGLLMSQLIKSGTVTPTDENWRLLLGTGVLGGFTTFSAFSFETAKMIDAGHWPSALLYTVVSVLLSVGAVFAGMALGRLNS
jgi:fluoride exporter